MLTESPPSVRPPSPGSRLKPRRTRFAVGVVALLAAVVVVKLAFFPSVREDNFALSERNLQQVHSGLVVLRPTRFAKSHFNGVIGTTVRVFGKSAPRFIGRNVSFRDLVALAYGETADRVALPSTTPQTNFDFLVTTRSDAQQKLRDVIRKKLGFVARREPHDKDVLAVKVENADLLAEAVSNAGKKQNVEFNDGKLCFTHVRVGAMIGSLEQLLAMPVVDKTGLTDFYDFCVGWDPEVQRQLQNPAAARALVDKILKALGLALQPDTAPVEMLVVKRASP